MRSASIIRVMRIPNMPRSYVKHLLSQRPCMLSNFKFMHKIRIILRHHTRCADHSSAANINLLLPRWSMRFVQRRRKRTFRLITQQSPKTCWQIDSHRLSLPSIENDLWQTIHEPEMRMQIQATGLETNTENTNNHNPLPVIKQILWKCSTSLINNIKNIKYLIKLLKSQNYSLSEQTGCCLKLTTSK